MCENRMFVACTTAIMAIFAFASPHLHAGRLDDDAHLEKSEPRVDAEFWVEIDVEELIDSGLFDRMMPMMGGDSGELRALVQVYERIIGLDPWKDIRTVELTIDEINWKAIDSDPFSAFASASAVVELEKPGNLEGLLLLLPEYSSSRVDNLLIHSVAVEEFGAICVALVKNESNTKVLAARDAERIRERAAVHTASKEGDSAADLSTSPSDRRASEKRLVRGELSNSAIKSLLSQLQAEQVPGVKNIAPFVRHISFESRSGTASTRVIGRIHMTDVDRANQLHQLIDASVGLMIAETQDDSAMLAHLLRSSTDISVDSKSVVVETSLDTLLLVMLGL